MQHPYHHQPFGNPTPDINHFQPSNFPDHHQITITFKDQVFIFDGVPTQKVQAVLLLLGGFTFGRKPIVPATSHHKTVDSKRQEYLNKYRYKRNRRCYEKRIMYDVRHEAATRMHRERGQFAQKNVEAGHLEEGNNGDVSTVCTHCGTGSSDTPMMRKGPDGPKSLCNACGLQWASKGAMPVILKRGSSMPSYKCGHA